MPTLTMFLGSLSRHWGSRLDRLLWVSAFLSIGLAVTAITMSIRDDRGRAGYVTEDHFNYGSLPSQPLSVEHLVLWISPDCGACVDSADFYRRLTSMPRRTPIIVLSPSPVDELRRFLEQHGIKPDRLASTEGQWLKFTATPTILLLSGTLTVKDVWYGRLRSSSDERRLVSALTAGR